MMVRRKNINISKHIQKLHQRSGNHTCTTTTTKTTAGAVKTTTTIKTTTTVKTTATATNHQSSIQVASKSWGMVCFI